MLHYSLGRDLLETKIWPRWQKSRFKWQPISDRRSISQSLQLKNYTLYLNCLRSPMWKTDPWKSSNPSVYRGETKYPRRPRLSSASDTALAALSDASGHCWPRHQRHDWATQSMMISLCVIQGCLATEKNGDGYSHASQP